MRSGVLNSQLSDVSVALLMIAEWAKNTVAGALVSEKRALQGFPWVNSRVAAP